MHPTCAFALCLLLGLACGSAQAQWKWRDASGRVTASDLPPPSSVAERDILARPSDPRRAAPAATAPAAPASATIAPKPAVKTTSTDPELEARRKRAADEQAAAQRQQDERNAAARSENCGRARSHLNVLNEGKRTARTNAKGEIEIVDDKGRAEEVQRARAVIDSDCK